MLATEENRNANSPAPPATVAFGKTAELMKRVQRLREVSNLPSVYYLVQSYVLIFGVALLAIVACEFLLASGWSPAWTVAPLIVAIVFIGAAQHRPQCSGPRRSPPYVIQ